MVVAALLEVAESAMGIEGSRHREALPSLLILALFIIALGKPMRSNTRTSVRDAMLPVLSLPVLLLGLCGVLVSWWRRSATIDSLPDRPEVVAAVLMICPGGASAMIIDSIARRVSIPHYSARLAMALRAVGYALVLVCGTLTIVGTIRRMQHPSADTVISTAAIVLPETPFTSETTLISISPSARLGRCTPMPESPGGPTRQFGVCLFRHDEPQKVPVFTYDPGPDGGSTLAYERESQLIIFTARGMQTMKVVSLDAPLTPASVIEHGNRLGPSVCWLLMGGIACIFAAIAARPQSRSDRRWVRAKVLDQQTLLLMKPNTQRRVPEDFQSPIELVEGSEVWIEAVDAGEDELHYRTVASQAQPTIAAQHPEQHNMNVQIWALSAAVLLIMPLLVAASFRMLLG